MNLKKAVLFALVCFWTLTTLAQTTVTGLVTDGGNKEPLIGANVIIKGTTTGATTDMDGRFSFNTGETPPFTLQVSYLGYETREIQYSTSGQAITIALTQEYIRGKEVVVSASRVSEKIIESPVSIEKIGIREIRSSASGNFYLDLANLKGVDVVTSSAGFSAINMRGFNTTSPVRMVQFIDGMDNQAPGLNFPVGNLVGANDLDLHNIELINGAASALYGPNAFQGVVSMTTRNPYDYQGIGIQLRGGNRGHMDGQWRYAQAFGQKQKFAIKFTGGYSQIQDWEAGDPVANLYGDIETEQNLSAIVRQLPNDESLSQEDRDKFFKLNQWLDFNQVAFPGKQTISAPGYLEKDIADYTSKSLKLGGSMHYRFNDDLELSYTGKYGNGTAIYQGTNRYSINNIRFQQHKLELTGKRFSVKAYTTIEDAGDSYDMVFTAINLSKEGVAEYVSAFLSEYFGVIDTLTNGFDRDAKIWMVDSAKVRAQAAAANSWIQPGTEAFDTLFKKITTDPDLLTGSKFQDRSSLQHLEGQYNFDFNWADVIAGASVRQYMPRSFGTIFSDTLANAADTLSDGSHKDGAKYVSLNTWEVGGFVQASKRFFDDRLRVIGSVRVDKNQNFKTQFSPRLSFVYTLNNNTFRISAQSAFRSPTLQNQYIRLDLGPITLVGNLDGYDNLYTWESVQQFNEYYDSTFDINTGLLVPIKLNPLKPESVQSIEAGYRTIINNKLFIDFNVFFSRYKNFIGDIRVARPHSGIAGEESGENDIITSTGPTKYYDLLQIPVNAKEIVTSYGAAIGLNYSLGRGMSAYTNYSFNDLNADKLTDPVLPGFNTPRHKINVGLTGRKVWQGLGFNTNFRWVDEYLWQSSFGDGQVPSYHLLDVQLSYEWEKIFSSFRVGASNVYNREYRTAWGSPMMGRLLYATWTFEFDKFR